MEQRQESHSILLRISRKRGCNPIRIGLFPAEQWPERGGTTGRYRVLVDRRWHGRGHRFMDMAAVLELCRRLIEGRAAPACPACPVARGDEVRVPSEMMDLRMGGASVRTRVMSEPILGADGRWWVLVVGRRQPLAVDQLEVLG